MNASLLGIYFYKGSPETFLETCKQRLRDKVTTLVVTPNPEMLYEAQQDKDFLDILQSAEYVLPDGVGIFVAYQLTASRSPSVIKLLLLPFWCTRAVLHNPKFSEKYGNRITGAEITRGLLLHASKTQTPVTIIDPIVHGHSLRDVEKKASQNTMRENLVHKYPGLLCDVIISDEVPEHIQEHGIILATHGNKKQETLLRQLLQKFPHSGLALGVGGSIDLITGFRASAPKVFQRCGMEWLYRLMVHPRKHTKRMKKVALFLMSCI